MLLIGYWLGRYVPGVARHIELVIIAVIGLSLLPGFIGWARERRVLSSIAVSTPPTP
jgi:membrane-associated protein